MYHDCNRGQQMTAGYRRKICIHCRAMRNSNCRRNYIEKWILIFVQKNAWINRSFRTWYKRPINSIHINGQDDFSKYSYFIISFLSYPIYLISTYKWNTKILYIILEFSSIIILIISTAYDYVAELNFHISIYSN